MKKILFFCFLSILLSVVYFLNKTEATVAANVLTSKKNHDVKNKLSDGIYFLYKKCNLTHNRCHKLKPIISNGSYFLDRNQEPYEERMYLYIKGNIGIAYTLIYYDEEMIPTIVWSKLEPDKTKPYTYIISENTTVSGLEYNMSIDDFDFSTLENAESRRIKIGDTPKGKTYFSNQLISFNFEKNGDFSIDCRKYLNNLAKQPNEQASLRGAVGDIIQISCNSNEFFRNTAQYDEKRMSYFKKIGEIGHGSK